MGHSINAPTGRWQKNKDIHWYQRDKQSTEEELAEEIRKLKEAEAEALSAALYVFCLGPFGRSVYLTDWMTRGFAAGSKPGVPNAKAGPATGSNAVAVPNTTAISPEDAEREMEKEERRRRKAERKEEKRAKKEEKRKRKAEREDESDHHRHHHNRQTRSRSPRRHSLDHSVHRRHRSPTPSIVRPNRYSEEERERERERDRRRWADNSRREQPGARWGRD